MDDEKAEENTLNYMAAWMATTKTGCFCNPPTLRPKKLCCSQNEIDTIKSNEFKINWKSYSEGHGYYDTNRKPKIGG